MKSLKGVLDGKLTCEPGCPFLAMLSNWLLRLLLLAGKLLSIRWSGKSSSDWQSGVLSESTDQQSLQHDYQQLRHFAQFLFFFRSAFSSPVVIICFLFHKRPFTSSIMSSQEMKTWYQKTLEAVAKQCGPPISKGNTWLYLITAKKMRFMV